MRGLDIRLKPRKSKAEVCVNQDKCLSDLQTLIKHSFLLNFLNELLMNILNIFTCLANLCSRSETKVPEDLSPD